MTDIAELIFKELSLSATPDVKKKKKATWAPLSLFPIIKLFKSDQENYSLSKLHNIRKAVSLGKAI